MNVLTYVLNKYGMKGFLLAAVFGMLAIDNYEKRQELASLKQELNKCYTEKAALKQARQKSSKKGIVKPKRQNFIYEYEEKDNVLLFIKKELKKLKSLC